MFLAHLPLQAGQHVVIIQPNGSLTVGKCFYFLAPVFMLLAGALGIS